MVGIRSETKGLREDVGTFDGLIVVMQWRHQVPGDRTKPVLFYFQDALLPVHKSGANTLKKGRFNRGSTPTASPTGSSQQATPSKHSTH